MISGETVTVRTYTDGGFDEFNNPVQAHSDEAVAGVVVAPYGNSEPYGTNRQDSAKVALTLHFPKTFTASLRGCDVQVGGEWYRVIGNPQRYEAANCPTLWNMEAQVERTDG